VAGSYHWSLFAQTTSTEFAKRGDSYTTQGAATTASGTINGPGNPVDLTWSVLDQLLRGIQPAAVAPSASEEYWQTHIDGANFAFADGHAKFLVPGALRSHSSDGPSWSPGLPNPQL